MDADEIAYLRELRQAHLNRLRVLELKAAQYGINCPPEVQTEIDEIKKKIENLEQRIENPIEYSGQPTILKNSLLDLKKLSIVYPITIFSIIVVIIVFFLNYKGVLFPPTNPTSAVPPVVTMTTTFATQASMTAPNGTTITPVSQSMVTITLQNDTVDQVPIGSFKMSGGDYLALYNGTNVAFSKMKSFEIVRDDGKDNITVMITLLNGQTITERMSEYYAGQADITGETSIGPLDVQTHLVKQVEFQR